MKHSRPLITSLASVPDEEVLIIDDVAAILRISSYAAREHCMSGRIPGAFRIGGRVRIQAVDVRKTIESEKLPKNIDVYNLFERLSSRGQRPKRNVTDGRLRMTVAQLIARLEKRPKGTELASAETLPAEKTDFVGQMWAHRTQVSVKRQ